MPRAIVHDKSGKEVIIAESGDTILIEGNHYFPPGSVNEKYLVDSDTHTTCFWKGDASYKTVKVGDMELQDAAWYYPEPMDGAVDRVGKDSSNYYAFWRSVEIED